MRSALLVILLHAAIAAADSNDAARAFERGQAALQKGRVHDACSAFEESEQLSASLDTEVALAGCYERDGKPVSAAAQYRRAAERDAGRSKAWLAKAAKLEASAPKLRFAINPMPDDLVVKVDGRQVSATDDVLVDTGPHEVIATAPGYEGHASAPVDREGAIVDVIIRMQARPETAPPLAAPAPIEPKAAPPKPAPMEVKAEPMAIKNAEPAPRRSRAGLVIGASGIAVLVGAGVVFELSARKLDDEHALCPNSRCSSAANLEMANELISDARTLRGVSLGMAIGGGVLAGVGTYLLLRHDAHVSMHAEPGGAAVAYSMRF